MSELLLTYTDRVRYTLSHDLHGYKVITEPKGWKDDDLEYSRHKRYHGLIVNFSNSLTFVEDGAKYILDVEDLYGINAEIVLKREERHPKTDEWVETYTGVLDLSELKETEDGVKVKLNSSGLETILKSRENEKIEIERETDLDGNKLDKLKTYTIEAPERMIFLHSEFEGKNKEVAKTRIQTRGNIRQRSFPLPISIASKSDERIHTPLLTDFEYKPNAGHLFYADNDRDKKLRLKLKGKFIINPILIDQPMPFPPPFIKVVLSVYENGNDYDLKEDIVIYEDANPLSTLKRLASFEKDLELKLKEGDGLCLRYHTGGRFGTSLGSAGQFFHDFENFEGFLTIDEDSFFDKSSTKIVMAKELGNRITEIITGKKDVLESETLGRIEQGYEKDGANSLKGYACGHWIRNFDKEPNNEDNKYKPFTTSFKDFMEDLMVTNNLGLSIEKVGFKEKIVIKPLEEFYVDQVTIRLPGQVNKVERKVSKNHYFSSVQIGCTKGWENEEAMGLDEYNTQTTFFSPITRIKKEVKKLTNYIYASYAFEFIRRKPIKDYSTIDHPNDKEIFALDLKRFGDKFTHRLWQDDLEEKPKGVYSPETAYNLRYTPLQMLLRHKRFLASSFQKYLSKYVRFGSSEGNSNLTTKRNGVTYNEKQDTKCREFGLPKYLPKEITFEHIVDFGVREQLNGTTIINGKEVKNIYGLIEFINEKGERELGRFQKLKPNGKGKWTLLKAS